MHKTCSSCKETKNTDAFAKRGSGLQSRCRMCHSGYMKEHYGSNKQYYIDKARKNSDAQRDKIRLLIAEAFSAGCTDCGNQDIRVLEFDHLKDKTADISKMLAVASSLDKVTKEISKCEVVCANCHNIRTSDRSGDWRTQWHAAMVQRIRHDATDVGIGVRFPLVAQYEQMPAMPFA